MNKEDESISRMKQEELESILDAALDELDDDSDSYEDEGNVLKAGVVSLDDHPSTATAKNRVTDDNDASNVTAKRPVFGPERPQPNVGKCSTEEAAIKDMMRQMEALFPSELTNETKQQATESHIQNMKGKEVEQVSSNQSKKSSKKKSSGEQHEQMEETMSKLFKQLSQNMNDGDLNDNDFSGLGDDFMKQMAKEWESTMNGNGGEDQEEVVGQVVDGMMKQLLSKEFMYEPMKDICNQFPKWLAENKQKIDEKEYERYGTQYQYFQRIVHIYEYDPNNVARLTELMQEIQEFGQPPPELIKELAPDLDFDKDGIPKMDGSGLGPLMNEECCIM